MSDFLYQSNHSALSLFTHKWIILHQYRKMNNDANDTLPLVMTKNKATTKSNKPPLQSNNQEQQTEERKNLQEGENRKALWGKMVKAILEHEKYSTLTFIQKILEWKMTRFSCIYHLVYNDILDSSEVSGNQVEEPLLIGSHSKTNSKYLISRSF